MVIVACAIRSSAQKWLDSTKLPFPLLTDIDLTLYRHLGLRRRAKVVWEVETIIHYAQEKAASVSPSPMYEGDDLHVMGGDFAVDSTGKLVYAYSSKTPSDRPAVTDVLESLKKSSEC